MANDGVAQWSDADFFINFKQINEFLNKTSFEAISIMVFFQVIAIAFIIGRFSTLYLLMWLSMSFLIYSIAGPFFCLKWMLVFSSLVWHSLLFLWTHPYLVACFILAYGVYTLLAIWTSYTGEDEKELQIASALEILDGLKKTTESMHEDIQKLSIDVKVLQQQNNEDELVEDWLTDVPYPLDRRREAAKSLQNTPSRSFRNER